LDKRTNFPQTVVDPQAFEQFHASTVRNVHFRPLCRVQIALDKYALGAIFGELECGYQASGTGSHDEDWGFVFDHLNKLAMR
jgi:hypothetical protein